MASETDEIGTSLKRYEEASRVSVAANAVRAIIAGIPFAGGSILAVLDGVALGRMQKRLTTVFETMKGRLDSISTEKIDRAFFDSEEFQTLLYLLIEKLHTTHDQEKLRMFGVVLANCGDSDFKEDDKEQYVRTLRDLSAEDVRVFREVAAATRLGMPVSADSLLVRLEKTRDNAKASLSRLSGLGLIVESFKLRDFNPSLPVVRSGLQSPDQQAQALKLILQRYFKQAAAREYGISQFGQRFLRFVASGDE